MAGDNDDFLALLPDDRPKKDHRSRLLRAKQHGGGMVPNACPCGCTHDEIDARGFCKHLVGFTVPGDDTTFHPRKVRPGRDPAEAGPEDEFVDGKDPQKVRPGDRLERISVSSRVYRRTAEEIAEADADQQAVEDMIGRGRPRRVAEPEPETAGV